MKAAQKMKREPTKVVCLECGKTFKTFSLVPACVRCGGVDLELAE